MSLLAIVCKDSVHIVS